MLIVQLEPLALLNGQHERVMTLKTTTQKP
jgi:hypothetical protein